MALLNFKIEQLFEEMPLMQVALYKGYKVFRNDDFPEPALLTFKDKPSLIVVEKSFFDYPEESQEFILLHEIGHDVANKNSDNVGQGKLYDRNILDEFKADQYATSIKGKDVALRTFDIFERNYKWKIRKCTDPVKRAELELALDEIQQRAVYIRNQ
jgi:hypothetical protein